MTARVDRVRRALTEKYASAGVSSHSTRYGALSMNWSRKGFKTGADFDLSKWNLAPHAAAATARHLQTRALRPERELTSVHNKSVAPWDPGYPDYRARSLTDLPLLSK